MNASPCFSKTASLRMRAAAVLCFLLLVGVFAGQRAAAQDLTTVVPFITIEPDSRASALGNTGVARADDASAGFWNPAGLGFQRGTEVAFTHINYLPELDDDLALEYLAGRYYVDGVGTFGAQVTYFNLGESEIRLDNSFDPDATPETFKSQELTIGASYGVQLGGNLSVGTGLRYIFSDLAPVTFSGGGTQGTEVDPASSIGFDLAALYRTNPFALGNSSGTFSAGFNLANMGPPIQYLPDDENGVESPIPTNLRFGTAFTVNFDEYNSLTLTNDFKKVLTNVETFEEQTTINGQDTTVIRTEADPFYKALFSSWGSTQSSLDAEDEVGAFQQISIGTGLEYWYNQLFALRTGYYYEDPNFGNRQFLTFGAGLRYNVVAVDVSYLYGLSEENDPLSNTLRFSVGFDL